MFVIDIEPDMIGATSGPGRVLVSDDRQARAADAPAPPSLAADFRSSQPRLPAQFRSSQPALSPQHITQTPSVVVSSPSSAPPIRGSKVPTFDVETGSPINTEAREIVAGRESSQARLLPAVPPRFQYIRSGNIQKYSVGSVFQGHVEGNNEFAEMFVIAIEADSGGTGTMATGPGRVLLSSDRQARAADASARQLSAANFQSMGGNNLRASIPQPQSFPHEAAQAGFAQSIPHLVHQPEQSLPSELHPRLSGGFYSSSTYEITLTVRSGNVAKYVLHEKFPGVGGAGGQYAGWIVIGFEPEDKSLPPRGPGSVVLGKPLHLDDLDTTARQL
jgi:hypothetical protein